jgi:hypothetical protein
MTRSPADEEDLEPLVVEPGRSSHALFLRAKSWEHRRIETPMRTARTIRLPPAKGGDPS